MPEHQQELQSNGAASTHSHGSARAVYEQLGAAAASSGVCIDLFAIGRQHLSLAVVAPLCQQGGGACVFYPAVEGSALPQVRQLACPEPVTTAFMYTSCANRNAVCLEACVRKQAILGCDTRPLASLRRPAIRHLRTWAANCGSLPCLQAAAVSDCRCLSRLAASFRATPASPCCGTAPACGAHSCCHSQRRTHPARHCGETYRMTARRPAVRHMLCPRRIRIAAANAAGGHAGRREAGAHAAGAHCAAAHPHGPRPPRHLGCRQATAGPGPRAAVACRGSGRARNVRGGT